MIYLINRSYFYIEIKKMSSSKKMQSRQSPVNSSTKKKPTGINFKIYDNGDLYVGNLIRGKIQGAGVLFFENPKIRCEGVWSSGLLNGTGRQIGPMGEKYIGEFLNGIKNGQGRFTNNKGKTIIGQFKEGEINGLAFITDLKIGMVSRGNFLNGEMNKFGTLNSLDGRYRYSGFFQKGVFQGLGIEDIAATQYFGYFEEGLRDGIGKYEDRVKVKFVGNWKEGEKKGFGIERYPTGDIFEGDFSKNLKSGIGRYHHKNDYSVYTGEFKNGLRDGFGRLESSDFLYIGYFSQGQRNGKGYQFYKNGMWYYGDWLSGLKHGFGYESTKKIFYKGEWQSDKPHGYALIKDQEGVEKFAVFEYGILKNLSVNIPKKLFEFFENLNVTNYLESGELRITEFENYLNESCEILEEELRMKLQKTVIEIEEKKLFGILKQISINVENMEISFGKIMKNLEDELKKANIDMRKLMKSYKYNLEEEKREDVIMVMDANRGLKTLELMKKEAENFESITSLERKEELKAVKNHLERIFEENFLMEEKPEREGYLQEGTILKDKCIITDGVFREDEDFGERKKNELREVVDLLQIEKEDLKKRKEEIVMLLNELKEQKMNQEEQVKKTHLIENVEVKKEEAIQNINEEKKIHVTEERKNNIREEDTSKKWIREDEIFFNQYSNRINISDFETELCEKNSKILQISPNNEFCLTNKRTISFIKQEPNSKIEFLASQDLSKNNF